VTTQTKPFDDSNWIGNVTPFSSPSTFSFGQREVVDTGSGSAVTIQGVARLGREQTCKLRIQK
jgi:hypothetical protein